MDAQIITVSSKGQIALPVNIRRLLSIETGSKLIAYTYGDVIMLKVLKIPTAEEFEAALDAASEWAESAGYKEEDVQNIIKEHRKDKRRSK